MSTEMKDSGILRDALSAATLTAGLFGLVYWYRRPIATWAVSDDEQVERDLIHRFMPEAEFAGEVSIKIHASPQAIFAAIENVTLNDMPVAKWIGQLRYLPGKLSGEMEHNESATQTWPFIELLQANQNIILAQEPNRELVIGAIGKFHNLLDQQMVALRSPSHFVAFDEPDYQKLAMSFRISSLTGTLAHRLTLVHGTHALSEASRRKFAFYWLGIKPGGNLVTWLMLRAIKTIAEKQAETTMVAVLK
jgi:hypothetical protein